MEKKTFKTETHLHTDESSGCGHVPAAEFVRLYKEAGYSTIFVTDHYTQKGFSSYESSEEAFNSRMERYLTGYRSAKEEGDKIGVTVLLGAEARFGSGNLNDYLIYNITEDILRDRVYNMSPEEFFDYANERGILVIAAHPFRGLRRPVPHAVHGFEVLNANPRNCIDTYNDIALKYTEQNPHLLRTGGSDAHEIPDTACGGIETEFKINTAEDYIYALRCGKYKLIDNMNQGLIKLRGI